MPQTLLQLLPIPQLGLILLFVAVNVLLGVALAIKAGAFDWQELPEFLRTRIIPAVLGYATMYAALQVIQLYYADSPLAPLASGFALLAGEVATPGAIIAALVQRIAQQVAALGSDTPVALESAHEWGDLPPFDGWQVREQSRGWAMRPPADVEITSDEWELVRRSRKERGQ